MERQPPLRLDRCCPPNDRVDSIVDLTLTLARSRSVPARMVLRWLGLTNSAADQIHLGRLHMRPVQLWLLARWRLKSDPLEKMLSVPHELLRPIWAF